MTVRRSATTLSGHDLTIAVQTWNATLRIDNGAGEMALTADSHSFHVLAGVGGPTALTDDDKARIERAINDDVLKGCAIEFHSTEVVQNGEAVNVHGKLELGGEQHEIVFELAAGPDGRLAGSACVQQHTWGIKAFSVIFGPLPVGDEVHVVFDAALQ